jgi:hypothetical protein
MKFISYIKLNWWRFTPDSWIDWYYYHKSNVIWKFEIWQMWNCKPWDSKYRCPICAGNGIHPKYGDECDDCKGEGFLNRYEETFMSKMFKFARIRKKKYLKN